MASHVSHIGVHDHGFNNVSTYGNLLRLMREHKIPQNDREQEFYELALKVSGAIQASRWTQLADGTGSSFVQRRAFALRGHHPLVPRAGRGASTGACLDGEQDRKISLLQRLIEHALNTARYSLYYGRVVMLTMCGAGRPMKQSSMWPAVCSVVPTRSRDIRPSAPGLAVFGVGDLRVFGTVGVPGPLSDQNEGAFECIAPQLFEGLNAGNIMRTSVPREQKVSSSGPVAVKAKLTLTLAACAAADFYLANSCTDGIPMWERSAKPTPVCQ